MDRSRQTERSTFKYLSFLFLGLCVSCSLSIQEIYFSRGKRALESKDYPEALSNFDRIVRIGEVNSTSLEAAREGSRICVNNLKEYGKGTFFLSYLALNSSDETEVIQAQKQLVDLLFYKIGDYTRAVEAINRLINFPITGEEKVELGLLLARSYFYLNEFSQSQFEIDRAMRSKLSKTKEFEFRFLRSNVLLAQKKMNEAILAIKGLIADFPKESKAENVSMNLAVAYEEKGDFDSAIETLKGLRDSYNMPEFVDVKIQRLEERQAQLPGARGFRK